MLKDIPNHKVENLVIAIAPREEDSADALWDVYLINLEERPIRNVLVNSRGYGELEKEPRKTTVLRHFFEEIGPMTYVLIEPIQKKLFSFTNEYWVSFSLDNYLYDKKYVFVKGSIDEMNFTALPFINRSGVMIR